MKDDIDWDAIDWSKAQISGQKGWSWSWSKSNADNPAEISVSGDLKGTGLAELDLEAAGYFVFLEETWLSLTAGQKQHVKSYLEVLIEECRNEIKCRNIEGASRSQSPEAVKNLEKLTAFHRGLDVL